VEDTAKRFADGYALIAEADGEYLGTITVIPPQPNSPVALYRDPHTWSISQFAVAPSFKGKGFGKMLHEAALVHARRHGARAIALDTAQPAENLIAMWRAWGYKEVGTHDWRPHTNYLSVVMWQPVHHSDVEPRLP
jgi:ribosomal protein S18 acetylase RimI-like enzyme